METTIRISSEIKQKLDKMKMFERETYNELIGFLIEDQLELNEKTKKEINEAKKRVEKGDFYTEEEAKKILDI